MKSRKTYSLIKNYLIFLNIFLDPSAVRPLPVFDSSAIRTLPIFNPSAIRFYPAKYCSDLCAGHCVRVHVNHLTTPHVRT